MVIGKAENIPVSSPTPVLSLSPVVLPAPGRAGRLHIDLQIRVSAPTAGRDLPIILLSHGHGRSNHLLVERLRSARQFWAAHGLVVIQPHSFGLKDAEPRSKRPEGPLFWRSRVEDMKRILDQLTLIEASFPGLSGRLDRCRIAVAGHSMGGHTASMLLGARLTDPEDGTIIDMAEPRIKAGVLLAAPGNGGADLSAFASEHYPFFPKPSFAETTTLPPSACSLCLAQDTGLAELPGTTLLKPRTRVPNELLPSSGSPGLTSGPRSILRTPPGPQRVPPCWITSLRWDGSKANESPLTESKEKPMPYRMLRKTGIKVTPSFLCF